MVIAAIAAFAVLLVAWILAPSEPSATVPSMADEREPLAAPA